MKKERLFDLIENIPLTKGDIEVLIDEENTHYYSLWKEYELKPLPGPMNIWFLEFQGRLRQIFQGEHGPEISQHIRGRIPSLIYKIKEEGEEYEEKNDERIRFLLYLYRHLDDPFNRSHWKAD